LVDDHPIVRQGLTQLINEEPDLAVCGEADDLEGGLLALETLQPDVVLVDISLGGANGIDLIKRIRAGGSPAPVLVVSMHDESIYAERALRAGARGYIMKDQATSRVLTAIRRLLEGEIYLSERMVSRILHKLVDGPSGLGASPLDRLSDRELEVFQLIGPGRSTRQIAERLQVSVKTIETYRAHIKEKLRLTSAAEVFQRASQWVHEGAKSL
jgi:DNA-binding NarL/FixJ family response regulator